MKIWERRVVATITLGGSYLGLVLWATLVAGPAPWLAKLVSFPFMLLYAWGVYCGVQLMEGQGKGLASAAWYWLIQVPSFTSPLLGYLFTSGAYALVSYTPSTAGLTYLFIFGSKFEYSLLQPDKPFSFGINLFALLVAGLLFWRFRQAHMATPPAVIAEPVAAVP
jgi:ABC-type xylose transport system permease subunit